MTLLPPVRRRRAFLTPPYRPCVPGSRSLSLRRVADDFHRHSASHQVTSAVDGESAGLRAPQTPESISRAYERLMAERDVLMRAGPGAELRMHLRRAPDADARIALLQAFCDTVADVDHVDAELLLRPRSLRTANRRMVRLRDIDIKQSVDDMCEVSRAKAASVRDAVPFKKRALGQTTMAGMRLAHYAMQDAKVVDLSHAGFTDAHIEQLVSMLDKRADGQGVLFRGMQALNLSHNAITDAHMASLAAVLQWHPGIIACDLRGNPITTQGIAAFNDVSHVEGAGGLTLADDLRALDATEDNAEAILFVSQAQENAAFELRYGTPLRVACGMAATGGAVLAALNAEPGVLACLRDLDLSGKTWTDADFKNPGTVFARDAVRLEHLDLSDTVFTSSDLGALCAALSHAPRLKSLRFTDVPEGADAHLAALVARTSSLTHIAAKGIPSTDAALLARAGFDPAIKPAIAPRGENREAPGPTEALQARRLAKLYEQVQAALKT